MAGLRIATVSTVALTTVGVLVGHGGLGQLITGGFNANFYRAEIVTGTDRLRAAGAGRRPAAGRRRAAAHPLGAAGAGMSAFQDALVYLNDPFNWTRPNGILDLLAVHLRDLRDRRPGRLRGGASRSASRWAPPAAAAARSSSCPNVSRAMPTLALLTLFAVSPIGFGTKATTIALAVFAFPPILTNTSSGFRGVDADVARGRPRRWA